MAIILRTRRGWMQIRKTIYSPNPMSYRSSFPLQYVPESNSTNPVENANTRKHDTCECCVLCIGYIKVITVRVHNIVNTF